MKQWIYQYPFASGLVLTTLKTSAADLMVQLAVEKKTNIDKKRNSLFSIFGLTYLGGWQYYLYNHLLEKNFKAPLTKVLIDQCIHHPLGYFPAFYTLKTIVYQQPLSAAWDLYKNNIVDDLLACWSIWVPAQYINFRYVPIPFRIPFVCTISFAWTGFLSWKRA